LNARVGSHYRASTGKTKSLIRARLNEGFSVDDFKTVIEKKAAEWMGSDMEQYLRPETLFGTKFEGYLNAPVRQKRQQQTFQSAQPEEDDYFALAEQVGEANQILIQQILAEQQQRQGASNE
jgi:uncharacterized phage protein (TIGR02220 family)